MQPGFLLKDGDADVLRAAIRAAPPGDALMSPRSLPRLIDEFTATPTPSPVAQDADASLTPREREVLILVARGLNNAEIADALTIGGATAKTHVGNLLAKLHCRGRAQLVITAFEACSVTPGGARGALDGGDARPRLRIISVVAPDRLVRPSHKHQRQ